MSHPEKDSDLQAYLTRLALPPHLRTEGGKITQEILRGYNTPGISIAVLPPSTSSEYSNTPLLASAFGKRDSTGSGSLVDPDTTFQAGSISKPFTSLAVLRLVAQGKLRLDSDVEEYLAHGKDRSVVREDLHISTLTNPATAPRTPITLRLLLAHKSGLSTVAGFEGYYGKWAAIPSTPSIINGVTPANHLPIRAFTLPGLGIAYSGGGTVLVQHILTLVTGKPFPALMHELVLEPLGMTRSTFEQPIGDGQPGRVNYAKSHHNAHTGYMAGTECLIHPEMAAAGLWSTPRDLLKGLRAVFDCLAGTDDSFLPPLLVAEAFTEHNGFGGVGVGWRIEQTVEGREKRRILIGHPGGTHGFTCELILAGDAPLVGRDPPVRSATPPVGLAWMTNSDEGPQLGRRIRAGMEWIFGERLTFSGAEAKQQFFPVLTETPVERERAAVQIEGWRAWKGEWKMADGGDVELHGPHVTLDIEESDEGLPLVKISVLVNTKKPLVLLPAAYHRAITTGIIWVVRDMDVSVVMKETKPSSKENPRVLSLEIWQNGVAYRAERASQY